MWWITGSVEVLVVWLTGWERLDPVMAFAVGLNILVTGSRLVPSASAGLMDVSLPKEITDALMVEVPDIDVLCHIEPAEDPRSYEDSLP